MLDVGPFDLTDLQADINAGVKMLQQGVATAVEVGVAAGERAAKDAATFKDRSGNARSKISGTVLSMSVDGGETRGQLVCDVPYASYLEDGTAPHVIRARGSRGVLSWIGSDGERHFARSVNHPGTKGIGFMAKGAAAAEKAILDHVEKVSSDVDAFFNR